MKNNRIYLGALALLFSNVAYAGSINSNCETGEQILFSCVAKKKVLSYCISPKGSQKPYIEYRFSAPGKEKFTFRSESIESKKSFERATISGASTSSTVIWFKNYNYTYVLNDPVKGIPQLEILKNKKSISTIECDGEFSGNTGLASPLIRDRTAEDFFGLSK